MKSKVCIFLFFLSINLFFSSGHFYFYDEMAMYEVAKSTVEKGDFSIPSENVLIRDKKGVCYTQYGFGEALIVGRLPLFGVFIPIIPHENLKGKDGKMYSPFGIGQSIAVIPFYGMGILLSRFFPKGIKGVITEFVVSLFNSFINALIGTIIVLFVINLGYRFTIALFIAIIYEFFTFSFEYSKMFYAEPLITLCLIEAIYCLYKHFSFRLSHSYSPLCDSEQSEKSHSCCSLFKTICRFIPQNRKIIHLWFIFFAGLLMGFGILTKIAFSISVIPLIFYIFFKRVGNLFLITDKRLIKDLIKILFLFLFPIFISILIVGMYNFHRFGNFLETGYGDKVKFHVNILEGLYGLLFSSSKSIFIYSPILIMSVFIFPKFAKKYKPEGILFIFLFILNLLFYSKWSSWQGGFCWGPRFLLPTLPFLVIPLSELLLLLDKSIILNKRKTTSNFSYYFIISLLVIFLFVTFFIQLLGMTVRFDYIYSHFGAQPLVNSAFEKNTVFKISVPKFMPINETFKVFKEVTKNTYKFFFFSKNSFKKLRSYEDIVNTIETRRVIDFWWIYFYFLGFRKFVFCVIFLIIIILFFCGVKIFKKEERLN